eukprot:gene12728-15974_t
MLGTSLSRSAFGGGSGAPRFIMNHVYTRQKARHAELKHRDITVGLADLGLEGVADRDYRKQRKGSSGILVGAPHLGQPAEASGMVGPHQVGLAVIVFGQAGPGCRVRPGLQEASSTSSGYLVGPPLRQPAESSGSWWGPPLRSVMMPQGASTSSVDSSTGEAGDHSRILLVGPEGDFTADELRSMLLAGATPVGLGDLRLRTETAAIALLAFLRMVDSDT